MGLLVKSAVLAALGAIFVFTPTTLQPETDQTWLFFDGVCNLCDGFVNFVADFESPQRVKFGAIQRHGELLEYSGAGQYAEGGSEALTTVVLVQDGRIFVRSTAAARDRHARFPVELAQCLRPLADAGSRRGTPPSRSDRRGLRPSASAERRRPLSIPVSRR